MIPIIISGACGRTGRAIVTCGAESKDFEIFGALEAPGHPDIGKTVSNALGIPGCDALIMDNPPDLKEKKPVLVEFSNPEATMDHLDWAVRNACPLVIGTTALGKDQIQQLKIAGQKIPLVLGSNMSVGVNLLFKLVEETTKILGTDYDAEIVEIHHRYKKDAPSGTAVTLSEKIAVVRGQNSQDAVIFGRKGITDQRNPKEIGMHSLRGGDVVGEHTVVFATMGERVELTHRCHSRNTFALGALRAARFVFNREPGFFDMQDVLGIK